MTKLQQLVVGAVIFAVFWIGMIIHIWNQTYPHIPHCFENAPDLQPLLSASLEAGSPPVSPQITLNNVHELARLYALGGFESRVTALAISADDWLIAAGDVNGDIQILDLATGKTVIASEEMGAISSLAISPSNMLLASADFNGDVVLWDTNTGNQTAVWSFDRSSDRHKLLFASPHELVYSTGASVYLCDVASKENRKLFDSIGVAASEDGDVLARGAIAGLANIMMARDGQNLFYSSSGDNDSTGIPEVGIWNFASAAKAQSFTLHGAEISAIAMSANGERLASISRDGTVYVVDLLIHETISSFAVQYDYYADYSIALNADGDLAIVGDQMTAGLSVWNVDTRSRINDLSIPDVTSLMFNHAGTLLITGNMAGMVDMWGLHSPFG